MAALALLCVGLLLAVAWGLWHQSRPILAAKGLGELISSSLWRPLQGQFGLLPFIAGTLAVTAVAVAIAEISGGGPPGPPPFS